ncbi:MAG: hypothetical protein HONBIEJF_02228 [Fimbriimonadaceae bacterium]|nr:hypothetical protein [Fimbriimonadaceae bacterium]
MENHFLTGASAGSIVQLDGVRIVLVAIGVVAAIGLFLYFLWKDKKGAVGLLGEGSYVAGTESASAESGGGGDGGCGDGGGCGD